MTSFCALIVLLVAAAAVVSAQELCQDEPEELQQAFGSSAVCDRSHGVCSDNRMMGYCNRTCGLCPTCPFLPRSPPCKHHNCFDGDGDGLPDSPEHCKPIVCAYCLNLYAGSDASSDPACNDPKIQSSCDQVMCDSYALCDKSYSNFDEAYAPAVGKKCLNDCHGAGVCNDGECWCLFPHTGKDCSDVLCTPSCDHGTCSQGVCTCDSGWDGERCNQRKCVLNGYEVECGHGLCNNGTCACFEGYTGATCNESLPVGGYGCMVACSSHGSCQKPRQDPVQALTEAQQALNQSKQQAADAEALTDDANLALSRLTNNNTLADNTTAKETAAHTSRASANADQQVKLDSMTVDRARRLVHMQSLRVEVVALGGIVHAAEAALLIANSSEGLSTAESAVERGKSAANDKWDEIKTLVEDVQSDLQSQLHDKTTASTDSSAASKALAAATSQVKKASMTATADTASVADTTALQDAQLAAAEAEEAAFRASKAHEIAAHQVASTYAVLGGAHSAAVEALTAEAARLDASKTTAAVEVQQARTMFKQASEPAAELRERQRTLDAAVDAAAQVPAATAASLGWDLSSIKAAADAGHAAKVEAEKLETAAHFQMLKAEANLNTYMSLSAAAHTALQFTHAAAERTQEAMGEEIGLTPGVCTCDAGWTGGDCSLIRCPSDCSGNGECDGSTGNCSCSTGWGGPGCGTALCDLCVNGACEEGQCVCEPGWKGPSCDVEPCPNKCFAADGHGVCKDTGSCACDPEWYGDDCGKKACPRGDNGHMCSDKGACNGTDGTCMCAHGYAGRTCRVTCVNGCKNGGSCEAGACKCVGDWEGESCEQKTCPRQCSRRGVCNDGRCACDEGFEGMDCGRKSCPKGCSGHGTCFQPLGQCKCQNGWMDADCSTKMCPGLDHRCNAHHGTCEDGACKCASDWAGHDCYSPRCTDDCNGNGVCKLADPLDITSAHVCHCRDTHEGDTCELVKCDPPTNPEGGSCDQTLGVSVCLPEWYPPGEGCYKRQCPHNCTSPMHGSCAEDDGAFVCVCQPGYKGYDCSSKKCPQWNNPCSGNGACLSNGTCFCQPGWAGSDCSERTCPSECSGPDHGICHDGICLCLPGWSGQVCNVKECLPDCWHGDCVNGECLCEPMWEGGHCQFRKCPADCSGHGDCDRQVGECDCRAGWQQDDCAEQFCIDGCVNGDCVDGQCVCWDGFTGVDCSQRLCPNDCTGNGRCDNGVCFCYDTYQGVDCSKRKCHLDCSSAGTCNDQAVCECVEGREGNACEKIICPNRCTNPLYGTCDYISGTCTCFPPYYKGPDCATPVCELDCFGHGRCELESQGVCACDEGWQGKGCSIRKCLSSCHHHGGCNNGTCECYKGYFGPTCKQVCKNNCTDADHGVCSYDEATPCDCKRPYYGADCSVLCPGNGCSLQGECQTDGSCKCDKGWAGADCSLVADCPEDCSDRGSCYDGVCTCDAGYSTYDYTGRKRKGGRVEPGAPIDFCRDRICPDDCNGHGRCNDGVCECDPGWTEAACNVQTCVKNCMSHGYCDNATCECFPGFYGDHCQWDQCPHDCSGHGLCVEGCCRCDDGYLGVDCSLFECPNDCSGHGQCDYTIGSCDCYSPYYGSSCQSKLPTVRVQDDDVEWEETEPIEVVPDEAEELKINEEQLRPTESFTVEGTIKFVIDLADWSASDNATVIRMLALAAGVSEDDVAILKLVQGSTILTYAITPPVTTLQGSAEEIERKIAAAFAGDFIKNLCLDGMKLCENQGEDRLKQLKDEVQTTKDTLTAGRTARDIAEAKNQDALVKLVAARESMTSSTAAITTLVNGGDSGAKAVAEVMKAYEELKTLDAMDKAKASVAVLDGATDLDSPRLVSAIKELRRLGSAGIGLAKAYEDLQAAVSDQAAAGDDFVAADAAAARVQRATSVIKASKAALHVDAPLPGWEKLGGEAGAGFAVGRAELAEAMERLKAAAATDPTVDLFYRYQEAVVAHVDAERGGDTSAVAAAVANVEAVGLEVKASAAAVNVDDGIDRLEMFVTLVSDTAELFVAEADSSQHGAELADIRAKVRGLEEIVARTEETYQLALNPMQISAPPSFKSSRDSNAISLKKKGCKRCRSGRETVEDEDRLFTRRCGRDGGCSKEDPLSIQSQCAKGCNDHCLNSCRRYHDPKTRTCARARRAQAGKGADTALASLAPEEALLQTGEGIVVGAAPAAVGGGMQHSSAVGGGMHGWIVNAIQSEKMAAVDVVESQLRKEVYVLSDCYAECSRQCIFHCIGEYGEPIPESPDDYPLESGGLNGNRTNGTNPTAA